MLLGFQWQCEKNLNSGMKLMRVTVRDAALEGASQMDANMDARSRALADELAAIDGLIGAINKQAPQSQGSPGSSVSRGSPEGAARGTSVAGSRSHSPPAGARGEASGHVKYISPMYQSASPSRAHLSGGGGAVVTNFSLAPRFKDDKQYVPGVGSYHPHTTAFSPASVPKASASKGELPPRVHTNSAALASTTMVSVHTASDREVERPLLAPWQPRSQSPTSSSSQRDRPRVGIQHASGNAVQLEEHRRKMEAVHLKRSPSAKQSSGSGGGSSASSTATFTLVDAAQERLDACSGDAIAALSASIRKENELRRELSAVREGSYTAKLEAQGALSNVATQLDSERKAIKSAEARQGALREKLRAILRVHEALKGDFEALLSGLRGAAQPDMYGRSHPAVIAAVEAALRTQSSFEGYATVVASAAALASGSGSSSAGAPLLAPAAPPSPPPAARSPVAYSSLRGVEMPVKGPDGQWIIKNLGSLAEQRAEHTEGFSSVWVDSGKEGFRGLVDLEAAKLKALGAAQSQQRSSSPRTKPFSGAIAASTAGSMGSTGPTSKFTSADVGSFASSLVAAGGSSFTSAARGAPQTPSAAAGEAAAAAAAEPDPARAALSVQDKLKRLFGAYCKQGSRVGEFFNAPAVKRDLVASPGALPKLVALSSTAHTSTLHLACFQKLVRDAGIPDSRVTLASIDLSFFRAFEHGSEGSEGSYSSSSSSSSSATLAEAKAQKEALARLAADPAAVPYLSMARAGAPFAEIKDAMTRAGVPARTISTLQGALQHTTPLGAAREELEALKSEAARAGGLGRLPVAKRTRLAALEHAFASAHATAGLSFDKFVIALTDVGCRKYALESLSEVAVGGLHVNPDAFRRILHDFLLPLEERLYLEGRRTGLDGGEGRRSPMGKLPRSLALLPRVDMATVAEAFSKEFLQPNVLEFLNVHTLAFKALFREYSEKAQHGDGDRVQHRGLLNFAQEYKVAPGVLGGETPVKDFLVCAREVVRWSLVSFFCLFLVTCCLLPRAALSTCGCLQRPPLPSANQPPTPPPSTHPHSHCLITAIRNTASGDYIAEAAGDISLSFPEFLEVLGLTSFVSAMSKQGWQGGPTGWQGSEGGSLLEKVHALVRETARMGAPWAKLPQGSRLVSECSPR